MTLINRLARLFRADLHAVLDRVEEPEALLRQAVREMEEALTQDRRRFAALNLEHGQLGARLAELDQTLVAMEGELDLCFGSSREDLARTLIRRQLETQRLRQTLEGRRARLEEALGSLGARVEEEQARLEAMRQKAELLAAETAPTPLEIGWAPLREAPLRDAEVEVAFLKARQQRSQPK